MSVESMLAVDASDGHELTFRGEIHTPALES